MRRIVVVGASLAGLRAAEAVRAEGFEGELTVIGAEPHLPYDRPPLSKDFLLGKLERPGLDLCDERARASLSAEWLLGRTAVGFTADGVELDTGHTVPADGVVVATGARARRPALADGRAGVHVLRTVEDAMALRGALAAARRVTVVGAGFIGLEVASAAIAMGRDVTVVEVRPRPFDDTFGSQCAALLTATLLRNHVDLRLGARLVGLTDAEGAQHAILADGTRIESDVVVLGTGAVPNTEWLDGSGVHCDDGVLTDAWGRTSRPFVVAAGDVARFERAGARLRVEHWTNARDMPTVAAKALLAQFDGVEPSGPGHDQSPYFWTEQFGHRIQLAGRVRPDRPVDVVHGSLAEERFVAVQRRDGQMVAVLACDMPREFTRVRRSNDSDLRGRH